jgi:hypothetical protein
MRASNIVSIVGVEETIRAILIAGFVLLGINGHAKADEKCVTTDDLLAIAKAHDPAVESSIYPAIDERGREDDQTFMVFLRPDKQAFLVLRFEGGCMKSRDIFRSDQFEAWLFERKLFNDEPPLNDTQSRIIELESKLRELLSQYTDKHPDVVRKRHQLEELLRKLEAERLKVAPPG